MSGPDPTVGEVRPGGPVGVVEDRRSLVAIMFADMVGYTSLMQEDEERARSNRDRHRDVLRATVDAHGGRILQYYGDGSLSTFPSAVGLTSPVI